MRLVARERCVVGNSGGQERARERERACGESGELANGRTGARTSRRNGSTYGQTSRPTNGRPKRGGPAGAAIKKGAHELLLLTSTNKRRDVPTLLSLSSSRLPLSRGSGDSRCRGFGWVELGRVGSVAEGHIASSPAPGRDSTCLAGTLAHRLVLPKSEEGSDQLGPNRDRDGVGSQLPNVRKKNEWSTSHAATCSGPLHRFRHPLVSMILRGLHAPLMRKFKGIDSEYRQSISERVQLRELLSRRSRFLTRESTFDLSRNYLSFESRVHLLGSPRNQKSSKVR